MKPLTQRIIDTTPAPKAGFKELRERGLVLRISAAGGKSWSFEYRSPLTKKNARITFEATSLADARAIVHRYRVALTEGRDPSMERKEAIVARHVEHARTITVRASLDAYEPGFLDDAPLKQKSRRERMLRLRRVLAPLMERAVSSISQPEMIGHLDAVRKNSGPIAANRAHAEIRAWLGWAKLRAHAADNVLDRVPKQVSEKSRERVRVLTDAELGAICFATTDRTPFSDIVRVLLHTGMRKGEVASLQPRDLDFEARTIKVRDESCPKPCERVIPMIDAIAAMLAERAEGLEGRRLIFSAMVRDSGRRSRVGASRPIGCALHAGERCWTLHDIRRTVATRLYEAGVDSLVIEDLLGHLSGVEGRRGRLQPSRDAGQTKRRPGRLGGQTRGARTNVVPFKRAAA